MHTMSKMQIHKILEKPPPFEGHTLKHELQMVLAKPPGVEEQNAKGTQGHRENQIAKGKPFVKIAPSSSSSSILSSSSSSSRPIEAHQQSGVQITSAVLRGALDLRRPHRIVR